MSPRQLHNNLDTRSLHREMPYRPTFRNKTNGALAVHLQPIGRPYGSLTAHWKAVQFIYSPLKGRTTHLQSVRRLYGLSIVCQKTIWFVYGPSESYTVHLQSIKRLYGSFTARQKAVQFIYSLLEGRTVYYTVHFMDHKQDLQPAQSTIWKVTQKAPQEELPIYFCILLFYFYVFLSYFMVLSKQIMEAIYKQFYFSSTASI